MLLKSSIILLLIVNIKLIKINFSRAQPLDCMEPFCTCLNQTFLYCNNFTEYDQLDFRRVNGYLFESVELMPLNRMLDLNEKLIFNGLKLSGKLTISNVKSFTAFYNPFRQILYDKLNLVIRNSVFKLEPGSFIFNQNEIDIIEKCDFQRFSDSYNYIFANLAINELTFNQVFFDKPICSVFFRNTKILNFILNDPMGGFGFDHVKFVPLNVNLIKYLNVNIFQIEYNYGKSSNQQPQWLDAQSQLYPFIFDKLDRVILNGALNLQYVQERTFELVPSARKFELNNLNIRNLLIKSRRWLKNLNYFQPSYDVDTLSFSAALAPNIFQLIIWVDNDEWAALDEEKDICLFRNFPHSKLVFPFLLFSNPNTFKCTCTIYWLYKYFYKYQIVYNLNQLNVPFHCFQSSNWDNCQFDVLFNRYCPLSTPDPEEPFTTLSPSTNFISTQTPPTSFSVSTTATATLTPSITTTPTTSTTTSLSTSSASMIVDEESKNRTPYALVAFYLAIALAIVAAFTTAAIIILFYKVLRQPKNKTLLRETSVQQMEGSVVTSENNLYL